MIVALTMLGVVVGLLIGYLLRDMVTVHRFMVRRRVLVTLKSEASFSGVLWDKRRGYLVLKGAQMHDVGERAVPVDGELVIERGNVDYVQVLSAVVPG